VPSPNGKKLQLFLEAKFCYQCRWWKYQRITNTPEQERHVQWSPDNKTLIYASERGESWDLYTKVERKEEAFLFSYLN
jgi:hypothetical protein